MALNPDPSRLSLSKTSESQLSLLCDIKCIVYIPNITQTKEKKDKNILSTFEAQISKILRMLSLIFR